MKPIKVTEYSKYVEDELTKFSEKHHSLKEGDTITVCLVTEAYYMVTGTIKESPNSKDSVFLDNIQIDDSSALNNITRLKGRTQIPISRKMIQSKFVTLHDKE